MKSATVRVEVLEPSKSGRPGNDSVCARSSSNAPAQALPSTCTLRGTSSERAFHATATIAPQINIESSSSSVCHCV